MARHQNAGLDLELEGVVVRDDLPVRIGGGLDERLRHRHAGRPYCRLRVIDGVSDAQHHGRRVRGVVARAGLSKVGGADVGMGFERNCTTG